MPQEFFTQLMGAWGNCWFNQRATRIASTDAQIAAIQEQDLQPRQHWCRLLRITDVPDWNTGVSPGSGITEWAARYEFEFPWPLITVGVPAGAPERRQHTAMSEAEGITTDLTAIAAAAVTVSTAPRPGAGPPPKAPPPHLQGSLAGAPAAQHWTVRPGPHSTASGRPDPLHSRSSLSPATGSCGPDRGVTTPRPSRLGEGF